MEIVACWKATAPIDPSIGTFFTNHFWRRCRRYLYKNIGHGACAFFFALLLCLHHSVAIEQRIKI